MVLEMVNLGKMRTLTLYDLVQNVLLDHVDGMYEQLIRHAVNFKWCMDLNRVAT